MTATPSLREAAQAVLDRWDSPQWEWTKHGPTADLMAALRASLAEQPAASEYKMQIIYALQRAERTLQAHADALSASLDYSAELPAEDAQRMREAQALLAAQPAA